MSEESLANETGELADGEPLVKIVIAAAIHNPYAGTYSKELTRIVEPSAQLGQEFGRRMCAAISPDAIQSYGKGCLVGIAGEYEHGNAFLTDVGAGPVRDAVGGGKAWVPSSGKIGNPGASIDIPLAHKDALYVRSHYDTITVSFTDSPKPDEILIAWAFASRGRLHARLGGLAVDDIKGEDGLR